jgi:RNA polymerase sigma-70 factor (ECF subfamily)
MGPSHSAARREANLSSCDCEPALEQAVVELYRNHFEGLFRFAMTITRDRGMAEDAIQDAFLRYFVACREGQVIRNPVPWLYRVLRNLLLDEARRLAWRPSGSDDAGYEQADRRCSPEAYFWCKEVSNDLRGSLSGRELECLQLRVEGMEYREIAQTLRIRPGTVGALLSRALKKARRVVGTKEEER